MVNMENSIIDGDLSDDIIKCLKNILSTPAGTVPFDRNFGIDYGILDEPVNIVPTLLTVEIIKKIRLYEPRVTVNEVTFTTDKNNNLIPKVRVE